MARRAAERLRSDHARACWERDALAAQLRQPHRVWLAYPDEIMAGDRVLLSGPGGEGEWARVVAGGHAGNVHAFTLDYTPSSLALHPQSPILTWRAETGGSTSAGARRA
jgi:hypothetical protein